MIDEFFNATPLCERRLPTLDTVLLSDRDIISTSPAASFLIFFR